MKAKERKKKTGKRLRGAAVYIDSGKEKDNGSFQPEEKTVFGVFVLFCGTNQQGEDSRELHSKFDVFFQLIIK